LSTLTRSTNGEPLLVFVPPEDPDELEELLLLPQPANTATPATTIAATMTLRNLNMHTSPLC
jgi:hypothetical protein